MSHLPERKEKDCLNCGAIVQGRFCQICGQENIEPKESFWHLLTHFMYDITHFDGKFFSTLKYLLFRPGFLSHEYLRGRRASYLHPIRMYVFTSAFFFLVFFSMNKEENVVKFNEGPSNSAAKQMKRLEKIKADNEEMLKDSMPDLARKPVLNLIKMADSDMARLRRDTTVKNNLQSFGKGNDFNLFVDDNAGDTLYKNVNAYDLEQEKLPPGKRDGFLRKKFRRQNIHLREKYQNDGKAILTAIFDKFKHLFPQMLFVSLPLFALLLRLLFVRRKNFFYVNHVVFAIHLYCGTFIIILAGLLISYLADLVNYKGGWVSGLFTLAGFFYWYKSMRNFYEQRRAKTILKYILVMIFSMIIMILLFSVFFIFSAMSI